MAITNMLQTGVASEWSTLIRERVDTMKISLNDLGLIPGKAQLRRNYEKFGAQLGAVSFTDFEHIAEVFFERAHQVKGNDFSIVGLPDGKVGIDYKGEMRGIFTAEGKPIAFFKPDYVQLGYSSKERELTAWRAGKSLHYV